MSGVLRPNDTSQKRRRASADMPDGRRPGTPASLEVTRVFGLFAAAAAAEHGVGEILQGNVPPPGPFIRSWPDAALFRIEGGEPALTLVPNLLASGVVTVLFSVLLAWRAWSRTAGRPRLDLAGLSLVLLLVGGGFGPPLLGLAVAAAASLPEPRPRPGGRLLAAAFPWLFGAAVVAWLGLVPGLPLLDLTLGVGDGALLPTMITAFTLFPLTVWAARARETRGSARDRTMSLGKE